MRVARKRRRYKPVKSQPIKNVLELKGDYLLVLMVINVILLWLVLTPQMGRLLLQR